MRGKLSGVPFSRERDYEVRGRETARLAAAAGMVLLKNENQILPLKKGTPLALYGAGAVRTIKGGTGSGDVNCRNTVSIWQGMKKAGFPITTEKWLADCDRAYENARLAWRDAVWEKTRELEEKGEADTGFFEAYTSIPFRPPEGALPEKTEADTAMYVLSRQAGEGKDREAVPGDYYLTDREAEVVERICTLYPHVILVLNTGGMVDLSFTDRYPSLEGILYLNQPGMEGGNALADIVSGRMVPGAKLTDSWPLSYEDCPCAEEFGKEQKERYREGIYVGYRYFDTFQVPVRYSFGYGLSYTRFSLQPFGLELREDGALEAGIRVTNTGDSLAGREVVQIYVSCPQEKQQKEYRRLAGFGKSKVLAPGESQELAVKIELRELASYCEEESAWMLEQGWYGFFAGNSLETAEFFGSLYLEQDSVLVKTEQICPLQEELEEIKPSAEQIQKRRSSWMEKKDACPQIRLSGKEVTARTVSYERNYQDFPTEVEDFTESLKTEQLIQLVCGDVEKGQGSALGAAGNRVPGSAAETSRCAREEGLSSIVLADGPAGLRLNRTYQAVDGKPLSVPFEEALENGFLSRSTEEKKGETYYQYCTALPVGTVLAQSWDLPLLRQCGKMIADEMWEFGVTLWLAPGMNIHRNPLCGRNFEYYSEDPFLSGKLAAAVTEGVQSLKVCGTTVKHFACNNRENERMQSDSIVSERALREIYLKGFEIAVTEAAPMALMTSYNLVNGVHAANSYDLCTKVLRNEWGYRGLIMTDWTTTQNGPDCTAAGCIRAGNDSIMPGCPQDHENLREELENGSLELRELKLAAGHLVNLIWWCEE